jgi:hypothetical protein
MRDDLEIPYPNLSGGKSTEYTPRDYRGAGGMDPNTRRMAIIAGVIGGSLLLLMGVWSLTGHRRTGIPVIEADVRPLRERPVNKGGLSVPGADENFGSGEAEGKPTMAPAPEAPAIAALKTRPAPVAEAPAPEQLAVAPRIGAPAEAARPGAAAPANITPAAVALAPVAKPAPTRIATAAPVVAGAGKIQVQLAALPTEDGAKAEWTRLQHRFPDTLGKRSPVFTHTDRDGKQFWRVRVTGFAEQSAANGFCDTLRAQGGSCVTAGF